MGIVIATAPTPIWMRDISWPRVTASNPTSQAVGGALASDFQGGAPNDPASVTAGATFTASSTTSSGAIAGAMGRVAGCYGTQYTGATGTGGGRWFSVTWVPVLTVPAPAYTNPLHRFLWHQCGAAFSDPTNPACGIAWLNTDGGGNLSNLEWVGGASERPGFGFIGGPAGVRAALWDGTGIQDELPGLWNDTELHGAELRVTNRSPSRGLTIEVYVDGTLRGQLATGALVSPLSYFQLAHRTAGVVPLFVGGNRVRGGNYNALGLELAD